MKLIRVSMLAPIVLVFTLVLRSHSDGLPADQRSAPHVPLVPHFIVGFLILAALNSLALIPEIIANLLADISRWALLFAIAAVGMKTSLRTIFDVGGHAVILIVGETVFIALFILLGIKYLS